MGLDMGPIREDSETQGGDHVSEGQGSFSGCIVKKFSTASKPTRTSALEGVGQSLLSGERQSRVSGSA